MDELNECSTKELNENSFLTDQHPMNGVTILNVISDCLTRREDGNQWKGPGGGVEGRERGKGKWECRV